MVTRFPIDCNSDCEHYSEYDLSIDDIVCCCSLLGVEIDLCDTLFAPLLLCPHKNQKGDTK